MSDLTAFRDHCRKMSAAQHLPECVLPRSGWWKDIHPHPECPGCVTEGDRETWARLADEVDAYRAPQVDLFGEQSYEPEETR